MHLGNSLSQARKKSGFSQEVVAEKLGVSRQTISKWETGETLPDILQSKRLARLYHLSLDDLIDFDIGVQEIEQAIDRTSPALEEKVDWTKAWGRKYPILLTYRQEVDIERWAAQLSAMLAELKRTYGYSDLDAFLVLKDILATVWQRTKSGPSQAAENRQEPGR